MYYKLCFESDYFAAFLNKNVTKLLAVVVVSVSYPLNMMAASDTNDILCEEDESLNSVDSESEGDYGSVDSKANLVAYSNNSLQGIAPDVVLLSVYDLISWKLCKQSYCCHL